MHVQCDILFHGASPFWVDYLQAYRLRRGRAFISSVQSLRLHWEMVPETMTPASSSTTYDRNSSSRTFDWRVHWKPPPKLVSKLETASRGFRIGQTAWFLGRGVWCGLNPWGDRKLGIPLYREGTRAYDGNPFPAQGAGDFGSEAVDLWTR